MPRDASLGYKGMEVEEGLGSLSSGSGGAEEEIHHMQSFVILQSYAI